MKTQPTIDMARIFNLENLLADKRKLSLLSAGGTNDIDADMSERLKILRGMIKQGKKPKKPNGEIYSDTELLCLPSEKLKQLSDETASEDAESEQTSSVTTGEGVPLTNKLKKMSASLADIFNTENKINGQEHPFAGANSGYVVRR